MSKDLETPELLSNCCSANPIGEVVNNEGRCADCCEMAAFEELENE